MALKQKSPEPETADSAPPCFDLPPLSAIEWRSVNSLTRHPQQFWPREILDRPLVTQEVAGRTVAFLADPQAFRSILTQQQDFPRAEQHQRPLRAAFGQSVASASGENWRRQRRILAPVFTPKNLAAMAPRMQRAAASLVEHLLSQGRERCVSVMAAATRVSLDVMWRSLVDAQDRAETDPLVLRMSDLLVSREVGLLASAESLTLLSDRLLRQRPPRSGPLNLLSVLKPAGAAARAESLSAEELHDNALLFMQAGHDTTAVTIAWATWLLGWDREIQKRARDEVDRVAGRTPVGAEHAGGLVFLHQVVQETLRLYPSAPLIIREARAPLSVGHSLVPPGSVLILNFYALHRHRGWWRSPDRFDPDRFAPGSGEPADRYAFVPFAAGPRVCIGTSFALLELVVVLATLLQHVRLIADRSALHPPQLRLSLRPHLDMAVRVLPR